MSYRFSGVGICLTLIPEYVLHILALTAYYFLDEEQNMITLELSLDKHPRLNHGCVLGESETKYRSLEER